MARALRDIEEIVGKNPQWDRQALSALSGTHQAGPVRLGGIVEAETG